MKILVQVKKLKLAWESGEVGTIGILWSAIKGLTSVN